MLGRMLTEERRLGELEELIGIETTVDVGLGFGEFFAEGSLTALMAGADFLLA